MSAASLPAHQIVVAGRASRDVPPDRATWSVEIHGDGLNEPTAFADCSRRYEEILTAVREAIGTDGDVSTGRMYTQERWDRERRREIGYVSHATLRVECPVELASKVAGVAMSRPGVELRGPGFAISNAEEIREELLSDAIAAARQKAERLAAAAGREAGRVVSVREAGVDMGDSYGRHYDSGACYDMSAPAPEIATRDYEITAEVTVAVEFAD